MLTKKEKAAKWLELEKLEKSYRWVKEMKKTPEILFVVDWIYEKQSIKEANNLWLNIYAIFNTNGDDTIVTNMIPANTNSVKSINYLADSLAEVLTWITVTKKSNTNNEVKRTPANKTINKNPEIKKEETKVVV
jgi:small subunit ribosomal protein S2